MKKFFTFSLRAITALIGFGAVAAQAQFITLKDEWGATVNNTVIDTWWDMNTTPAPEVDVNCILNSSAPKVVNMRRYELQIPEDTTYNYYCWGECYAPAVSGTHLMWPAPETNTLYPGEEFIGFHAYYNPNNVVGTACFRFVWFDDLNPSDTAWVDICFNATPVGMDERAGSAFKFNAFPVPSIDGNVELTFDAPRPGEQMFVELHDALGQRLATQRVRTGQQRLVLGGSELASGLVFATLRVDGQVKATRRLVIAGH